MEQNRLIPQENPMGTMPIGKLVFTMSAPMMASMLFQALYNIVDSIFVSKIGPDALNAVSLAFPFQMLMMAFALGTGIGMNALISRYLGQKNQQAADRAANIGLTLTVILSAIFCIIGVCFAEPFFRFQTANENIIYHGTRYVTVCTALCIGLFGQMVVEKLLQSTGRTKLSMISQLCGAACNIILDPLLIFGYLGLPRLEVMGAAIATVSGQILALTVGLILNLKCNKELHFSPRLMKLELKTVKEIYKIGFPSIIMQCVGSLMNFLLNKILIGFTEAATAVFGIYFKIQSFVFMPVFGMNGSMVPIVSYNYGARKPDRVRKTTRLCIMIALCIMAVGTLIFELLPDVLLSLFAPSEDAIAQSGITFDQILETGRTAFRIIAVHFPFAGFCIVAGSVCQALSRPFYSLISSLCRQVVVLLPAAWLLSLTGNLSAIWWAFPMAEVACAVLNVIFIKKTLDAASLTA